MEVHPIALNNGVRPVTDQPKLVSFRERLAESLKEAFFVGVPGIHMIGETQRGPSLSGALCGAPDAPSLTCRQASLSAEVACRVSSPLPLRYAALVVHAVRGSRCRGSIEGLGLNDEKLLPSDQAGQTV